MLEQIQKFSDSEVFSVTLENEPEKTKYWFRATDLCQILFAKGNSHKYVTLHCKEWQYREFQVGMGRPALYVCESGVYRLILRSKAPVALDFQDWLTEEVLPKLRTSGAYVMPNITSEQLEALKAEIATKENIISSLRYDKLMLNRASTDTYSLVKLMLLKKFKEYHVNPKAFLKYVELTHNLHIDEEGCGMYEPEDPSESDLTMVKFRDNRYDYLSQWCYDFIQTRGK